LSAAVTGEDLREQVKRNSMRTSGEDSSELFVTKKKDLKI